MENPRISNRRYGYQFGAAASVLALVAWWRGWWTWLLWVFFLLALLHLALAILAPQALTPVNRAWMGFGHILGRVVAPVVLGLMFLLLITPIALFFRLLGRDELRLRIDSDSSYWVARKDPQPTPDSFQQQY